MPTNPIVGTSDSSVADTSHCTASWASTNEISPTSIASSAHPAPEPSSSRRCADVNGSASRRAVRDLCRAVDRSMTPRRALVAGPRPGAPDSTPRDRGGPQIQTLAPRPASRQPGHMQPRLDLLTVAVPDLDAARRFYVDGLGWEPTLDVPGEVVFLQLGHGLLVGLFGAADLAADMGQDPASVVPGAGFALAHNV